MSCRRLFSFLSRFSEGLRRSGGSWEVTGQALSIGSRHNSRAQPVPPLLARTQRLRRRVPLRQPLAVPWPVPPACAADRAAAASQLCPGAELGSTASSRAAALPVTVSFVAGPPQIAGPCSLHPYRHLCVVPLSGLFLPSLPRFFFRSNNCCFCCRCRDGAGFFSLFSDLISFF